MNRLDIDRTWHLGPLYMDACGGIQSKQISLGIIATWSNHPGFCWGRRISLHLLWWCVSFGVEGKVEDE